MEGVCLQRWGPSGHREAGERTRKRRAALTFQASEMNAGVWWRKFKKPAGEERKPRPRGEQCEWAGRALQMAFGIHRKQEAAASRAKRIRRPAGGARWYRTAVI